MKIRDKKESTQPSHPLFSFLNFLPQLTYLGPPFNEKDFSPPRPNSTALSLPSAATRLELWHGLENQARLAQNQKAYSVLLAAVRDLARSTLCPSLKTSLLHFCTGLDGLLGSISALMTTLGYALPPPSYTDVRSNSRELQYTQRGAGGDRPAPLMSHNLHRSRSSMRSESSQRNSQRRSGAKVVRGQREDGGRRGKEGRRVEAEARSGRSREKGKGESQRRGRRAEPESREWTERAWQDEEKEEMWGRRRRLLSTREDEEEAKQHSEPGVRVSYPGTEDLSEHQLLHVRANDNNNQYSYNLNSHQPDTFREEDGFIVDQIRILMAEEASSTFDHQRRPARSLLSSTFPLLYQLGAGEEHTLLSQPVPLSLQRGTSLLSPPLTPLLSSTSTSSSSSPSTSLLSVQPSMNDFARKVEGFWILRELQSWLWRSAKDFNRLKKRLRG